MVEDIVKYISIAYLIILTILSLKKPILLILVSVLCDDYLFYSVDLYALPFKIIPGITLYIFDIPKIIIFIIVIYNYKKIKNIEYLKYLKILLVVFIFTYLLKLVFLSYSLNFDSLKYLLRVFVCFLYPLYFCLYYKVEEEKKVFYINFNIIVVFALVIFFLEYFNLYDRILSIGTELTKKPEEVFSYSYLSSYKKITIFCYSIMYIAPAIYIMKYYFNKKRIYLILVILILAIFFFTGFRSSFFTALFSTLLAYIFLSGKHIFKSVIGISFILTLIIFISYSILPANFFSGTIERLFSTITDIQYQEGSGGVRIIKTGMMIEQLLKNPILIFFGSYFTGFFDEIAFINMGDLGIIVSIAYYGLIMIIPAIYFLLVKTFNEAKKERSNRYSFVIMACILGTIPMWIFNKEFFEFLPTTYMILYGLFLAESNVLCSVNEKHEYLNGI